MTEMRQINDKGKFSTEIWTYLIKGNWLLDEVTLSQLHWKCTEMVHSELKLDLLFDEKHVTWVWAVIWWPVLVRCR